MAHFVLRLHTVQDVSRSLKVIFAQVFTKCILMKSTRYHSYSGSMEDTLTINCWLDVFSVNVTIIDLLNDFLRGATFV